MSRVMGKPAYDINVNNKNADQPAHQLSLISVFVICSQDSIVSLARAKILKGQGV